MAPQSSFSLKAEKSNKGTVKMNYFLVSIILLLVSSCNIHHDYHNSEKNVSSYNNEHREPSYTIFVSHDECTECTDAYVNKGKIGVPPRLRKYYGDTLRAKDISLVGNFPFDLLEMPLFSQQNSNFILTGKLIDADTSVHVSTNNGITVLPVFYVEKWAVKN